MSDKKVCPQCGTRYEARHRFCTLDGATLVTIAPVGDLVGSVIADRYHIISRLGDGGMGQVYLAEHVRMKRKCAVKIMRPGLMNDPDAISRFNREAENASQVIHQNVAAVYDFGETADGLIYLAMEYVDGESLARIIERENAIHPVRVAEIVRQASEALDVAHSLGILHRDLKPENIMIGRARDGVDVVKIVDFGIARAMASDSQRVTRTGSMVGTPEYMSPEQFAGDTLDARTDIYSLALVAFNMLTGATAYPSGSSKDNLIIRLTQPPRRLSDARDLPWPVSLQNAFDKALASDPAERYAGVIEFSRDVSAAIASMPASQTGEIYLSAIASALAARTTATPSHPAAAIHRSSVVPEENTGARTPVSGSWRRFSPFITAPLALAVTALALVMWRTTLRGPTDSLATGALSLSAADSTALADPLAALPEAAAEDSARIGSDVFERGRSGVLTVISSRGTGLGFLVDSSGLVLTASHLVRPDLPVSVMINDTLRVRARLVYADSTRDAAVLAIAKNRCGRCAVLGVAPAERAAAVERGATVIAFGATRTSRTRMLKGTLTSPDAAIPTVSTRFNSAESGSPILSLQGEVLGLGYAPAEGRGRIVRGAQLQSALELARNAIAQGGIAPPSDSLLPVRPLTPFPSEPIRAVASSNRDLRKYRASGGDFQIIVMTPQVMALRDTLAKQSFAKMKESSNGGALPFEVLDPVQLWRGWAPCVRERCAVVIINVLPEKLPFPFQKAPEFIDLKAGSVASVRLLRDGVEVEPIEISYMPAVVNSEAYATRNKLIFSQGVAMYRGREFARRPDGGVPKLVVELTDAVRPDRTVRIDLSSQLLQEIVNDFAFYGITKS